MRVENDELYGDWAHWIEARCPVCSEALRVHHLHEYTGLVCKKCGQNPVLKFAGLEVTTDHSRSLTKLLLSEGLLLPIAADVASELKADSTLQAFVEFLLSLHYVKPEALEALVRRKAPAAWIEGATTTFETEVAPGAPTAPAEGTCVLLSEWTIGPELVKRVPRTVARVYCCVPVWADGVGVVLAVDDPDKVRREDLEGLIGAPVRFVRAPVDQIREALKRHYGGAGWQEALW